jgi:predicted transcriptional regulator
MIKTFSTKLDAKVLLMLEDFCKRYHLKKSHVLEEIIEDGIRRRIQNMEFAKSLQKGLEEESRGELLTAAEVEQAIFGKKKAG